MICCSTKQQIYVCPGLILTENENTLNSRKSSRRPGDSRGRDSCGRLCHSPYDILQNTRNGTSVQHRGEEEDNASSRNHAARLN